MWNDKGIMVFTFYILSINQKLFLITCLHIYIQQPNCTYLTIFYPVTRPYLYGLTYPPWILFCNVIDVSCPKRGGWWRLVNSCAK